jgi:putative transcriptional regulator
MKIENHIKELRIEKGWTQEELARQVGVSRQSINSIERNKYIPSLPLALKFARIFESKVETLFHIKD